MNPKRLEEGERARINKSRGWTLKDTFNKLVKQKIILNIEFSNKQY